MNTKIFGIASKYVAWGALFGALYAVVYLICDHGIDPDFGWHLAAGRYYAHHGIPTYDVFTYTAANFRWINHEWLSDIMIAGLYHLGGITLVSGMFAGFWTLTLAAAARWRWAPAAVAAGGLSMYVANRPLVFTPMLLGAMLLVWWKQPRQRWLIPPLFALWANLHGGFSLGLIILAGLIVWERQWRWWWLVPAGVLATFINPYGPRLYVEIWRTLSDHQLTYRIAEWGPLQFHFYTFQYVFIFLFALLALDLWKKTLGLISVALLAGTVLTNRQFIPFAVISLPIVSRAYSLAQTWLAKHAKWGMGVLPILAAIILGITTHNALQAHRVYPEAAIADLRAHPCDGNLFNSYDYGGYLIWQLPQQKVYIDGRMPSWKDARGESYMDNYYTVMDGGAGTTAEFTRYNIRCAIVPSGERTLSRYLKSHGWHQHAVTRSSTLWRKSY